MIPYLICFAFIFSMFTQTVKDIALENAVDNKKLNKTAFILFSALLILLLSLKHDYVGTDTQNYRYMFSNLKSANIIRIIDITPTSEFGFYYFSHFLASNGIAFRGLLFIQAVFVVCVFSAIIYRHSKMPWVSWFLYMTLGFFIFYTTMRQCFALSFTLLASECMRKNKLLLYLLFCAVAVSFHNTALVFVPIYWVYKMKYNKFTIFLFIALFVAVTVSAPTLMRVFTEIIEKDRYEQIATRGYITFLLYFSMVVFGVLNRKIIQDNPDTRFFFYMMGMVLVMFPLFQINPALSRIWIYFSVYIVLYVPNMCALIENRHISTIILAAIVLYGLISFFYKANQSTRVLPYVFFWQEYPSELIPLGILPAGGF